MSILESPFAVVVVGLVLAISLCGGWARTGRKGLLVGAVGAVVLTIGALALERFIVTDREQVETVLRTAATDLEKDDKQAVVGALHSTAGGLELLVETGMQRYEFEEVSIKRNLEIQVLADRQPPKCVATFNVMLKAHEKNGMDARPVLSFVKLTFLKEHDQWRIAKFEPDSPTRAFQRAADAD